ncbi:MAG: SMI1/KNR4 family protein [Kofleriaceae bacterium]
MSPLTWIDNTVSALSFWRLEGVPSIPPTRRDFQQLEDLIGGKLPEEYRRFVTCCGAAILGDLRHRVVAPLIDHCPWGPHIPMEFVYPAAIQHPDSAAIQITYYKGKLPKGLLPVAEYANRKFVCLDVGGKLPGSVWMWRYTRKPSMSVCSRSDDRPPEYSGLYRMAMTFSDLLRAARRIPY